MRQFHTPLKQLPMNWSEFFAMGGYATYVWSSYGLMAIILIVNIAVPLRKKSEALEKARRLVSREQKK